MRVLNNNVLIKEMQNNGDRTPEGVILPETLELQYEIGLVLETHYDNPDKPSALQAGNMVAYHANSGVRLTIQGQACRWILEGNVLAVLEEDAVKE